MHASKMVAGLLILVLSVAVSAWAAGPESKATQPAAAAAESAGGPASGELIDINTASVDQLQTLTGIGDALSKKIVENRPYRGKDDLVKKKLIPQPTYDKIKDKIIAKQK